MSLDQTWMKSELGKVWGDPIMNWGLDYEFDFLVDIQNSKEFVHLCGIEFGRVKLSKLILA